MFDFENLSVYTKAKEARKVTFKAISSHKDIDRFLLDQLKRSILSILLNIAEGTGKSSKADKRNFFTIARASTYETVAIIDLLRDDNIIDPIDFQDLYSRYEEVSKMMLGLINSTK